MTILNEYEEQVNRSLSGISQSICIFFLCVLSLNRPGNGAKTPVKKGVKFMKKVLFFLFISLLSILPVVSPVLAKAPVLARSSVLVKESDFNSEKLVSYLNRLGVVYKQAADIEGAYIVIRNESITNADRIVTIIVNDANNNQLEILCYPEVSGKFFNINRLANPEKQRAFYEKLVRVNHKSFGMFFVDTDGDVGLRFTFTTEDGVGYDAFKVAVDNCQRVADRFTTTIAGFMTNDVGY